MSFLPCGVTTLLTDLGLGDPSVGIMKGVMISRFAQIKIVDLCHFVPPKDVFWASFALAGSYKNFPPGTVHCAVVAAGFGTKRGILVAEIAGHTFVAPDNGLLTRVLAVPGAVVRRVDLERVPVAPVRRSLHTRDIVAPIGALLASGKLAGKDVGEVEDEFRSLEDWPVQSSEAMAQGVIVGEDRFGNLFTTLTEEDVPQKGKLVVQLAGRRLELVHTLTQVDSGVGMAMFNSFGMLEVAIRDGRASEEFAWERGTPIQASVI